MSTRSSRKKKEKLAKSRSHSFGEHFEDPNHSKDDRGGFEIRTSKIMGRYIVAKQHFRPSDVIIRETPLVVGPCTGCKVQCLGCYKDLEKTQTFTKCSECGWPLCSLKCLGFWKEYGHTQIECSTLKQCHSSKDLDYSNFANMRILLHAIVPLRCLILKTIDPSAYDILMDMESHDEIRKNIPEIWDTNQKTVVDLIIKNWGLTEFTAAEIHKICGILEVNCFEIGQGVNIRGLYPTAFYMSHSCAPNTNHVDEDENYVLTVRASVDINVDEPITLSYAYTLHSTLKRREHLRHNKFFECHCKRCRDPTELETYMGALICPKCKIGKVLSIDPLDPNSSWSCSNKSTNEEKCLGYTISAKSMHLLIERISKEVDNIDTNDVDTMEEFLHKYRNVLHPSHYLCVGVKLQLSQIYGKISKYLIHELSDEHLRRKKELCEEILKLCDIVEPGFTRLRGVTLYELHAPLMILVTREVEGKSLPKQDLRNRLKYVVRCLTEASIILSFEPKSSPEGIMGMAAKDALTKMKGWEKIIGKMPNAQTA